MNNEKKTVEVKIENASTTIVVQLTDKNVPVFHSDRIKNNMAGKPDSYSIRQIPPAKRTVTVKKKCGNAKSVVNELTGDTADLLIKRISDFLLENDTIVYLFKALKEA